MKELWRELDGRQLSYGGKQTLTKKAKSGLAKREPACQRDLCVKIRRPLLENRRRRVRLYGLDYRESRGRVCPLGPLRGAERQPPP